jgi:hypothetical protein
MSFLDENKTRKIKSVFYSSETHIRLVLEHHSDHFEYIGRIVRDVIAVEVLVAFDPRDGLVEHELIFEQKNTVKIHNGLPVFNEPPDSPDFEFRKKLKSR